MKRVLAGAEKKTDLLIFQRSRHYASSNSTELLETAADLQATRRPQSDPFQMTQMVAA